MACTKRRPSQTPSSAEPLLTCGGVPFRTSTSSTRWTTPPARVVAPAAARLFAGFFRWADTARKAFLLTIVYARFFVAKLCCAAGPQPFVDSQTSATVGSSWVTLRPCYSWFFLAHAEALLQLVFPGSRRLTLRPCDAAPPAGLAGSRGVADPRPATRDIGRNQRSATRDPEQPGPPCPTRVTALHVYCLGHQCTLPSNNHKVRYRLALHIASPI